MVWLGGHRNGTLSWAMWCAPSGSTFHTGPKAIWKIFVLLRLQLERRCQWQHTNTIRFEFRLPGEIKGCQKSFGESVMIMITRKLSRRIGLCGKHWTQKGLHTDTESWKFHMNRGCKHAKRKMFQSFNLTLKCPCLAHEFRVPKMTGKLNSSGQCFFSMSIWLCHQWTFKNLCKWHQWNEKMLTG